MRPTLDLDGQLAGTRSTMLVSRAPPPGGVPVTIT
jgi:hypothetical protein